MPVGNELAGVWSRTGKSGGWYVLDCPHCENEVVIVTKKVG